MRLNQITIPSTDVAKSCYFYQLLGLKLIVDALPCYVRLLCSDGEATFSIHEEPALPDGPRTTIYFECDDLDERVEQLQAKGIIFDQLPTDQSWRWREAILRDPDGHPIKLYFAGEDRINPPWRVK